MAEPMTEEELRDLRARMGRVPLCYAQESDTTIERLLATVDIERREDEAHAEALFRVAKMHDVVEAAHEVNRQMKATNGKVTVGAWAKLADALDMRVPTSERSSAAVVVEDPKPLRPREG